MIGYIQLLRRNPDFARLWLAQVISLTGDWFNTIVLGALVARFSDGSGLAVSLLIMARFAPPLVVSPYAGMLVDRFDRKKVLIISNVARIGIVLALLFANTPDRLWLIYVLTILQFTFSALFEPGQAAILPSITRRDDLVAANTLGSITWSVMLAVGALLGGAVAAVFGAATALVIDALTFAVAAALIATIRTDTRPGEDESREEGETGSFMEGLRYLRNNRATAATLFVKGASSITSMEALSIIFATQIFIIGEDGQISLGLLYAVTGLGAVLGPVVLNRFHDGTVPRMRLMVTIGFITMLIGWPFIFAAPTLFVLAIGELLRGFGGSGNWTYSTIIIQKSVPDRYLGRVFSADMAVFQIGIVINTLIVGVLLDLVGVRAVVVLFAIVSMLSVTLWVAATRRISRTEAVLLVTG